MALELRRDNTTSSAEQGFAFKSAIAAHGKWKVTLRNAALKGETRDADSLFRDDCCALGKMVYGPEGQRWGHPPVFVDLVEKHRVFHQRAGSIAQAINSGQGEKAAHMLESGTPFSEATHSVIGALHKGPISPLRRFQPWASTPTQRRWPSRSYQYLGYLASRVALL